MVRGVWGKGIKEERLPKFRENDVISAPDCRGDFNPAPTGLPFQCPGISVDGTLARLRNCFISSFHWPECSFPKIILGYKKSEIGDYPR